METEKLTWLVVRNLNLPKSFRSRWRLKWNRLKPIKWNGKQRINNSIGPNTNNFSTLTIKKSSKGDENKLVPLNRKKENRKTDAWLLVKLTEELPLEVEPLLEAYKVE